MKNKSIKLDQLKDFLEKEKQKDLHNWTDHDQEKLDLVNKLSAMKADGHDVTIELKFTPVN